VRLASHPTSRFFQQMPRRAHLPRNRFGDLSGAICVPKTKAHRHSEVGQQAPFGVNLGTARVPSRYSEYCFS
jgi:hypothetical protein